MRLARGFVVVARSLNCPISDLKKDKKKAASHYDLVGIVLK
jgi:hypothetical protein